MSHSIRLIHAILFVVLTGMLVLPAGVLSELSSDTVPAAPLTENLTFYTEQLPPYSYEERGSVKGFTVDILEEICHETGTDFSREKIHVVPWDDGYQAAVTGNHTVLFATARIPEREDTFKWVGPISTEHYVLFAPRESNIITIQNPEDLKGLRIGVVTGDASIRRLLDIGVDKDQMITGNNVSELITKVGNREIDLWAFPETTGRYYAQQMTGDYYAFKVVYPLEEVDIYYAFSKDIPDSTIQSFQNALDSLKQKKEGIGTSKYEQILGKYIPQEDSRS